MGSFLVNSKHTAIWFTNDSVEWIRYFSKSNLYSATSSPITERMILMTLMTLTLITLFSELKAYNATSVVWFPNKWLLWIGSFYYQLSINLHRLLVFLHHNTTEHCIDAIVFSTVPRLFQLFVSFPLHYLYIGSPQSGCVIPHLSCYSIVSYCIILSHCPIVVYIYFY